MAQHSHSISTHQSRLLVGKPKQQAAFYAHHTKPLRPKHSPTNETTQEVIFEQIKIYLGQHVKDKICLDELCTRFNCDKFNLLRQFKQYTGLSPINYLITLRIQNAKELMTSTDLPLVQIALESGFYDQSHFSNCFVKFVGLTPGEYRRRMVQDLDR
ncbi:MAG: AraC family transcriptional regulator [Haliscomenobacter sp.]|uniref:AraC family transcriptional regulator n=1 Tax=Haliscomenobacter sp. TaxID=2717303 RepID=UPI0029BE082E|nr:AraC family transcriptional regulator [Haliscomenobacter sp.]MDX2070050.1 AraC family transcriptional regulator [Haliscomenobacter sp.]